jgi:hypothetical protein
LVNRKVLASIESSDGSHCVDIFVRDDATFGFEEFRGEVDGAGRWQSLDKYQSLVFASGEETLSDAKRRVQWLTPSESWRW